MTTASDTLGLALMDPGEEDETWGDRHNDQVAKLLEEAVAGVAEIAVGAGNVTLTIDDFISSPGRHAVLRFTGAPGAPRTVTVPAKQKAYLLYNSADDEVTLDMTGGGTTVTVPSGRGLAVACDGVNGIFDLSFALEAQNALSADLATTALDSVALLGVGGSLYARRNAANTFSATQAITPQTASASTGTLTLDLSTGNYWVVTITSPGTVTLGLTGITEGRPGAILIKQTGGPWPVGFTATYRFPDGVTRQVTQVANAADLVSGVVLGGQFYCGLSRNHV